MPPRRPVWVHAASLGESIAALWITRRLVHAGLGPCLITTSTVSAQTYLRGRTDVQGRESFAGSVYGDGGTQYPPTYAPPSPCTCATARAPWVHASC